MKRESVNWIIKSLIPFNDSNNDIEKWQIKNKLVKFNGIRL